ncbi:putative Ig domain-containing protein [uncultured Methanolobus sp.]|uniref:putative Ig domain-containing protein n=1 Tax=uncultured Methanolobus sp. TaxID=218300 RepID=UPI0029C6BEF0|nr:putative Ig domain-containing protein [uncultured Methanolobus sp.]
MFPSQTKKRVRVIFLLISIVLFITVLPVLVSADSNETIVIGNTVANPGASFSLPIFVENVTNMNSLSMDLIFDPSLLSVDSIVANDTLIGSELTYYLNNSTGFANMTLSSVDVTAEEQFHIADIIFSALASGYSDIIIENVSLENNTMLYPAPFVFNGSVRVNRLPQIDNIADKVITAGFELSFLVSATDEDDDVLVYNVEGLPSGYDISYTTGLFMWTPKIGDSKIYDANFSVSDGFAVEFTHANITVNEIVADLPPEFDHIVDQSVSEGSPLSFTVHATDPDGTAVTYSSPDLPGTSILDPSTGIFSWTPDYDDEDSYEVTFIASSNGLEDSETITITVGNHDLPPEFDHIVDQSVSEGSPLSFTVHATDPDGTAVTYSSPDLPGTSILDPSTGIFSWTPDYDDEDSYEVTFIASSNGLEDSETITVTVGNHDLPPEFDHIVDQSVSEGSPLSFTVHATDPDGTAVTYSSPDLPGTSILDPSTGIFSWTPDYDDEDSYEVTFIASSNGLEDSETITITVGNHDLPPEFDHIVDQSVSEGSPLSFTVHATDPDGTAVTYSSPDLPGTSILDPSTGIFSWTPDYDDEDSYEVTFIASSNGLEDSETITITVGNHDLPPEFDHIVDQSVSEGSPLSFTVHATDPDGTAVTYSSPDLPGTSILDPSTGIFSWTPDYDDEDSYEVTFIASSNGLEDSETITITVGNHDLPPEFDHIVDQSVSEGSPLSFTVHATDPDGTAVAYSSPDLPGTSILDPSTGIFSWTPDYDDEDSYEVTFIASSNGLEDSETITITVGNHDLPPEFDHIVDQSVSEGSPLSFTVHATDPDGTAVAYSSPDLPGTSILDPSTGIFSWTPDYDDEDSYEVTFIASSNGLEDSETITITVGNHDLPPEFDHIVDQSVSEGSPLSFTVHATDPDGTAVTYSSPDLPGTSILDPSTGIFSWTPDYDDEDSYEVTFIASSNGLEDSETITITVGNHDLPPEFDHIVDQSVSEGSPLSFTVHATDPDGTAVTYSSPDLPGTSILDPSTGIFSWTPDYDDEDSYEVTFIASSNGLEDSETITITVGNHDLPPEFDHIVDQSVSEGSPLSFTVHATDPDGTAVTYSSPDLPGTSILDPSTGIFSWTPDYDDEDSYEVTFIASSNGLEDSETITITVGNHDLPPEFDHIVDQSVSEGSPLSFTVHATDPDGTAVAYSSPDLPGTSILDPSTGIFSWTPDYDDEDSYEVTFIASSNGLEDSETITITVGNHDLPPEFDHIVDQSVSEGSPLSFTVHATDPDGTAVTYSSPDLPGTSILDPSTGIFSWTPDYDDEDSYEVTFIASSNGLEDSETITITVGNHDLPPEFDHIVDQSVSEGSPLSFTVHATDPDGTAVTYSSPDLPGTSILDPSTGIFSWTPDYDDEDSYEVTFIASSNGLEDSETITITVGNHDLPPEFDHIVDQSVSEGSPLSFTVHATDPDGTAVTYSSPDLPGTSILDPSTGIFSWTPDYDDEDSYEVTFIASSNGLEDSETITITVGNHDLPPEFDHIVDQSVSEGSPLSFTVHATDPDGTAVTYSSPDLPGTSILDPSTGIFSWTPDYDDEDSYEVTFIASSNGLEDSETITVTVGNHDLPPEFDHIVDQSVSEGSPLSFTVHATDPDGTAVTYSSPDLPGTSILDPSTGIFSWTPDYDDEDSYEVTFIASSNGLEDSETITVTVGNHDLPPEFDHIVDQSVSEGSPLSFTVHATDPDGTAVTYSSPDLPGTSILDPSTGIFSWTPDYDDEDSYEVTFIASSNGLEDSETITVTVGNHDLPPEFDHIVDQSVSEGSPLSFTVHATDPDGTAVTYSSPDLPGTSILDPSTGIFSWTPDYDDEDSYEVTFIASSNGLEDSETININVVDVNREPMLMVIGSQSVDENNLLTITPVATDDDDDTLYYSVVDSPSGSEIDEATGIFTWTPTYEQDGSYLIRFVVSDGLLEDTEDVTVTVKDVNRPPVLNIQEPVNVPENSTLILDLNASDPDDDILEYSKDVLFGTLQEDVFSWKPGYEEEGVYSVVFTVNDSEFEVSKTVTINVTHTNSPPVIDFTSLILVNELETVTINLTAVDIDDDELEFSKDVEYGSISGNIFTWTPGINDNDIHKILFTVSDGQLSDSKLATIAVGNTNIAPVIVHIGTQQVRENEMLTFTLNASDVDDDTLTYSCSELPAGANIESTNGTFTWTPTYEQAGTYIVELVVSDGLYPAEDAVVIKVENVNRAPVFDSIPTHTVNETETLVIHLDASDPDGDGISFSTTAEYGKVVGNTFTWTPGYYDSGDYDLDFKVTDGYLTDNTTVHVEVYQTNMPPEIEDLGSYSVYENNTLQFFVKATDWDNDSLTYSVSGFPGGASFNSSTGQFTWKPSYTQSGTYSVEFHVTDGELNASEAVSIRVYDVDLSSDADFSGFETSSSSGGSGGSSSSGAEDYDNVAYKDYSMKYVTQGRDIVFEFPNVENDLEYVKFYALKAAGQVKAIIEILKDRSTLVSSNPPGDVYRNINIWVGDAKFNSAGYMSSAEISFKVEKKWLIDNNADPSSIRLYRYSGGSWNELKTSRIGADSKYYYYKAPTPGFSPFSIVSTGPTTVSVNTAAKSSTVENLQYSYDADTRLESTGSDSDAAVMNTALEPRTARPVDTGIVFIGIISILAIGSVLGYKSRNESVVLSRYYDALYTVSASVRNAVKWPMNKLSSESIHKDYAVICGKMKTIRSANYRGLCHKKIAEIKERQKH